MSTRTFMMILAGEFAALLWLVGADPTLRFTVLCAVTVLIAAYCLGDRAAANERELVRMLKVTTEALEEQLAREAAMMNGSVSGLSANQDSSRPGLTGRHSSPAGGVDEKAGKMGPILST